MLILNYNSLDSDPLAFAAALERSLYSVQRFLASVIITGDFNVQSALSCLKRIKLIPVENLPMSLSNIVTRLNNWHIFQPIYVQVKSKHALT